jgi:hypothetical protein
MRKPKDEEITLYVPRISPAERRRMAAEDAALARAAEVLARRAAFRIVGGTDRRQA